jgi:hypothetical protein
MKALYQNQQRECGYVEPGWNRRFVYPEGTLDMPNESKDAKIATFTIYLDRYDSDSCNWKLAKPYFRVLDTYTGRVAGGGWGLEEDLAPGTVYKSVCQFQVSDFPQSCYGRWPMPDAPHSERERERSESCFGRRPLPDTPFHNSIPPKRRVPITVHVSRDSMPLRPDPPSSSPILPNP